MKKNAKKDTGGCFFVLVGLFILIGVFVFLSITFAIPELLALLLSIIVAIFFTIKWLGMPSRTSLFQSALYLIIGLVLVKGGLSFLNSLLPVSDHRFSAVEGVTQTMQLIDKDSVLVYSSNRIWQDNYGSEYSGALTVRAADFIKLHNYIDAIPYKDPANFWGKLYERIDKKDSPYLDLVVAEFSRINKEKKLNQMEFAEMVVSCIQDIPYSFVFSETCLPAENYEDSIKKVLEECPECCIGDIAYGIQNPVSFLQNLKGDCDTRTVLIYSILKYFNYDIAILNSDFYRHSIIGINLPAQGSHKIYRGKKYAVWETTSKYFEAGQLPYSFNDITHWNVVLTSK